MTDEELISEIRRVKYTPTMSELARQAGVNRMSLYRAAASGRISKHIADAVRRVVQPATSVRYQNVRSPQPISGRLRGIP